jgi:RNase P protein component
MADRATSIDIVRGMVLSEFAAVAGDREVDTDAQEEFDTERVKVKVFVSKQFVALLTFEGIDLDYVMGDATVRQKIQRQVREAASDFHATDR